MGKYDYICINSINCGVNRGKRVVSYRSPVIRRCQSYNGNYWMYLTSDLYPPMIEPQYTRENLKHASNAVRCINHVVNKRCNLMLPVPVLQRTLPDESKMQPCNNVNQLPAGGRRCGQSSSEQKTCLIFCRFPAALNELSPLLTNLPMRSSPPDSSVLASQSMWSNDVSHSLTNFPQNPNGYRGTTYLEAKIEINGRKNSCTLQRSVKRGSLSVPLKSSYSNARCLAWSVTKNWVPDPIVIILNWIKCGTRQT